jgi:uncharacterized protein (TIGR02757 family)
VKAFLDNLLLDCKLDEDNSDPLLIARNLPDDAMLICALFAYGNVTAMIKFLRSLNFELLNASDSEIRENLKNHYYRFQSPNDVIYVFCAFAKMRRENIIFEEIFTQNYKKDGFLFALSEFIALLRKYIKSDSQGINFLFSKPFDHKNISGVSALKRYFMYLRWQIRAGFPDLGRWREISPADLIIPLDTHTFHQAKKLGLLTRNTADLKAALELTAKLREFDADDPIKYDFALYRLGQNAPKRSLK